MFGNNVAQDTCVVMLSSDTCSFNMKEALGMTFIELVNRNIGITEWQHVYKKTYPHAMNNGNKRICPHFTHLQMFAFSTKSN